MNTSPVFVPQPFDPRVAPWLAPYPSTLFTARLHFSIELVQRYTLERASGLLHSLGVTEKLRSSVTPDELCASLSFDPGFSPILRWLLDAAVELGDVTRESIESKRYQSSGVRRPTDPQHVRSDALQVDSHNAATLDLLDRAADIYPLLARGEARAEQLLFEPDSIELWLAYFRNDNPTYAVNNWVGAFAAVERVRSLPRFTVLEIGAGAGSGSEALLNLLNERGLTERIERYVATEPSSFFLRRAQRALTRRYPNVSFEFRSLNIDQAWRAQSGSDVAFDLIYGINVMHVAHDLAYTLAQARESLNAAGVLVMGECLHTEAHKPVFPEFIFQLLESFRTVRTDAGFRPSAGFLTADQWRRAMAHAGFRAPQIEPDVERICEFCPNFLAGAVCAQNDETSRV
jgi:SAM-dependent methyltransferase